VEFKLNEHSFSGGVVFRSRKQSSGLSGNHRRRRRAVSGQCVIVVTGALLGVGVVPRGVGTKLINILRGVRVGLVASLVSTRRRRSHAAAAHVVAVLL